MTNEKIPPAQKNMKSTKSTKRKQAMRIKSIKSSTSRKCQTGDILLLRCFYPHRHAAFFVLHVKKHKKHKKHKDANKRISDFFPRRCFLTAFKTVCFNFVRLCAFLRFSCGWDLFVKKKQNYPNTFIYIATNKQCKCLAQFG